MKQWKLLLPCLLLAFGVFAFSGVDVHAEDGAEGGEGAAAFAELAPEPEQAPAAEPVAAPVVQELAAAAEPEPVAEAPEVVAAGLSTLTSTAPPETEAPVALTEPEAPAVPEATQPMAGEGEELAAEGDGERQVNGQWYYYENGEAITGWKVLADGRLVYYNADGTMHFGERQMEDGKWYNFNSGNGAWSGGFTELQDGRAVFYDWENGMYFNKEGQDTQGQWWYFRDGDGARQYGFIDLDDGRTVYYGDKGMVQGEANDNGKWYYFDPVRWGDMAQGWQVLPDSRLVYYNEDGSMYFGERHMEDGKWYYFNTGNGAWTGGFVNLPDGRTVYYDWENGMYFGWHEIDGGKYYFRYGDGQMEAGEAPGVRWGMDISSYQGTVDWAAVKAAGIEFVILRMVTWRNGDYAVDTMFDTYLRQAKAHGIMVGAYVFSYAYDEARAVREADFAISIANQYRAQGITFDLPIYIDYEDDNTHYITNQGTSYDTRTNAVRTFMQRVQGSGYQTGFYANKSWSTSIFNGVQLQHEGYSFWLAYWPGGNTPATSSDSRGNWSPAASVWQYTSNGSVPGISGRVDLNYLYTQTYTFHG